MTDEFCKRVDKEVKNLKKLPDDGIRCRNRSCEMSDSEIMTILMLCHFVDSTKIAVCHNKRIFNHKVFKEIAKRGKSTMG